MLSALLISPKPTSFPPLLWSSLTSRVSWAVIPAKAAGESDEVAEAIRDHYRPRFAGDDLPCGLAGCVVAVADKLDTIAGMFAIGEPPTGSKDPFALRRSAIGVINILGSIVTAWRPRCLGSMLLLMPILSRASRLISLKSHRILCTFIKGRMEQIARDAKIKSDTVAAVSRGTIEAPVDFFALAHALDDARANDAETFDNLATAYARASHLADSSLGQDVDEVPLLPVEHDLLRAESMLLKIRFTPRLIPLPTLRSFLLSPNCVSLSIASSTMSW